jgi:toxin ParE1/3/4
MKYEVIVTDGALADLADIDDYLTATESIDVASHVHDSIEKTVRSLENLPNRGHFPSELAELGIQDYREIEWTTFRVIYRVDGQRVYVYVVASARRDFQALLQRRLLSL